MNEFWVRLAQKVVPFLIKEAVKCTNTKADDKLYKIVKDGIKIHKNLK